MPVLDINDLANFGVNRDEPPYMLPPEAWSLCENVRVHNGGIERMKGRSQVFGTPGVAPHFAMAVRTSAQVFWMYVSLTKAYVWNGVTHTNITRQTAAVDVDYAANLTRDWNGTLLGGIPILNNGTDLPQAWLTPTTGTKLTNLANWPSTMRAAVVRALGPYLVAVNVTDSGSNFPHLVRWSHPADPGSVPSSWDVTDPTKDTGQVDLPDVQAGVLREALMLRGRLILYKDSSTKIMSFIGGRFVFRFEDFLETSGILGPRCVAVTGDGQKHVVATQDDIIVHDGNQASSILDKRFRHTLFNRIDSASYLNSFMFTNPIFGEVWFCYPEQGQTVPNRALVWNYREGKMGALTESAVDFVNGVSGLIEGAAGEIWDTGTDKWDEDTGPWDELIRHKVVLCDPVNTRFVLLDSGLQWNGADFAATLQREGLALIGKKRGGEWIVDHQNRKFGRRLWPKMRGSTVQIRMGFQDTVDGAIRWSEAQTFVPQQQDFVDFAGSGRAIALEISSLTPGDWRLDGYRIEIEPAGSF